jgi:hypothetical protein
MKDIMDAKRVDVADYLVSGFHGSMYMPPFPLPFRLEADVHQTFELGILLAGKRQHHVEDQMMKMEAGDVYLVPAWEPHGWRELVSCT